MQQPGATPGQTNNGLCGRRYEVNFQDGIDCGGAYIKLLSDTGRLSLVGTDGKTLAHEYYRRLFWLETECKPLEDPAAP